MMLVIVAVIIILAFAAVFLLLKSKKTAPKTHAPAGNPPPLPAAENEYETILNSLLKLNIMMRKDQNFPRDLIVEIEQIIDDLVVVIPAMMERYPAEALTYEIKKIGKEHLYKTVKEYLDLSSDSRKTQAAVFKQTIANLKKISNRSRDIVEKNETAEFKTMANFLAGKFS